MTLLFSNTSTASGSCQNVTAGRAIPVAVNAIAPLKLKIDAKTLVDMGIVTDVSVSQNVAVQFQNAFGGSIYVTPFGDLPSVIQLGFIINPICSGSSSSVPWDYRRETTGSFTALQTYLNKRLLPKKNGPTNPVTVNLAELVFKSFYVGMQLQATYSDVPLIKVALKLQGWLV